MTEEISLDQLDSFPESDRIHVTSIRSLRDVVSVVERDSIATWTFPLLAGDESLAWMRERLDGHEQLRASRFIFDKHRRRFIVAHAVLRELIAGHLGIGPAEVEWQYESLGKPMIVDRQNPVSWQFNLSHSGEYGFLAVTRERPIGADVEGIRPLSDARSLADVHFSRK